MAVLLSTVVPFNAKTLQNDYSYTARRAVKIGSKQNKHE